MKNKNQEIKKQEQNTFVYTLPFDSYEYRDNRFSNREIKTLKFPINYGAIYVKEFSGCKLLEKVTLTQGLYKIEEGAFADNTACTEVVFPSSLEIIEREAFYKNPLTQLKLPNNLKEIGPCAFLGNMCTEIKVPSSVQAIGENAFSGWVLNKLTIPIHLSSQINNNRSPFLEDIHVRDNDIVLKNPGKKPNEYDVGPIYYSNKANLYIDTDVFNYDLIEDFDPLDTVHINRDTTYFKYGGVTPVVPRIVSRYFLSSSNPYFLDSGNLIFDKRRGEILFAKFRSPSYFIDPSIKSLNYLPTYHTYRVKRKEIIPEIDISKNHNFHYFLDVLRNKDNRALYVPDKEEIILSNCHDFAENIFLNHQKLEKIIICYDNNPDFDVNSFIRAILERENPHDYFISEKYRSIYFGTKSGLQIYIPKDKKYSPIKALSSYGIKVIEDDIEEPYTYIE